MGKWHECYTSRACNTSRLWMRGTASNASRADCKLLFLLLPCSSPAARCLQVWAELADGSCRWRQTGGEIKLLALKVPRDLPTKQLAVVIEPYSLKGGWFNGGVSSRYNELGVRMSWAASKACGAATHAVAVGTHCAL